jgi:hypothetical protein
MQYEPCMYFSNLIFGISVIRDRTWFDLLERESGEVQRGTCWPPCGILIIPCGITALSELSNWSI